MSSMRRTAACFLLMLIVLAACSHRVPAGAWRPDYSLFAEDSPLRTQLPSNVEVHPKSPQMIGDLYDSCGAGTTGPCKFPRLAGAPDNSQFFAQYGTPVYVVTASARLRTIQCILFPCGVQGVHSEDTAALFKVPVPSGAVADPSSDAHMVVYDPTGALAWEMFGASYSESSGHWKTKGGIRWDMTGPGYDSIGEPGTAVGAGVPMLGTILRPDEIRRAILDHTGVVPHVLSGGYDSPRRGCFIGPLAKTSDGDDGREWAIPEGAILQLDPSVDVESLGLNAAGMVIARTLQRYGMVIRDDTGAFQIDVENTSVEGGVDAGRPRLWGLLGITKDSLREIQANRFRVVASPKAQVHGPNCL